MPETLRKDRKDYSKPVTDKKFKRNKLLKLQENEVIFYMERQKACLCNK